jgi:beta-D-xylosidase 4
MPTSSRYLAALCLATSVHALFPDCTDGPLKNETICDKSASRSFLKVVDIVSNTG